MRETIFAVATGPGRAAVAVIRISGEASRDVLQACTGKTPEPRKAALTRICKPGTQDILDFGLVLWFPGPASFTGEDMVEMQVHGGRAVLNAMIEMLANLPGLRPAEPGEFTRRAFLNGKMDLAQVEGLADLIDSETLHQRKQALAQLSGVLGKVTEHWRSKLIEASGLIEAELDFADEGDVPGHVLGPVRDLVQAVLISIDFALASGDAGERLRDGLVVVIAGPPNAGKSSLMNRITDRDVAIVSTFKGTTRDVLSVNLELNGYPVELIDTAGIRRTRNPVEQAGIDRAKSVAKKADLVLWLHDSKTKRALLPDISGPAPVWKIQAKCDLYPSEGGGNGRRISALDGEGVGELLYDIGKFAGCKLGTGGSSIIVRHRQRQAFVDCREALARLVENSDQFGLEELAEDLRLAIRALGQVIGSVDVEEILGEIFSRFCIGK